VSAGRATRFDPEVLDAFLDTLDELIALDRPERARAASPL
jgi:response regulator RpfG family c-di-GMP phosphodiesterase